MPWGKLPERQQRVLTGWFGVRGIGSLYYLLYCLGHELPSDAGDVIINLTVSVVALSILLHEVTAQPILARIDGRQLADEISHRHWLAPLVLPLRDAGERRCLSRYLNRTGGESLALSIGSSR